MQRAKKFSPLAFRQLSVRADFEKALQCFEHSRAIAESRLWDESGHTNCEYLGFSAEVLENQAVLLSAHLERLAEGLENFEEALARKVVMFGPSGMGVSATLQRISSLLNQTDEENEKEVRLQGAAVCRVYEILRKERQCLLLADSKPPLAHCQTVSVIAKSLSEIVQTSQGPQATQINVIEWGVVALHALLRTDVIRKKAGEPNVDVMTNSDTAFKAILLTAKYHSHHAGIAQKAVEAFLPFYQTNLALNGGGLLHHSEEVVNVILTFLDIYGDNKGIQIPALKVLLALLLHHSASAFVPHTGPKTIKASLISGVGEQQDPPGETQKESPLLHAIMTQTTVDSLLKCLNSAVTADLSLEILELLSHDHSFAKLMAFADLKYTNAVEVLNTVLERSLQAPTMGVAGGDPTSQFYYHPSIQKNAQLLVQRCSFWCQKVAEQRVKMKTRSQEAVHRMAIHADAIKKGTASGALAVERCNAGDVEGALQARVEAEEHWTLAGRDATQELAAVDRLIAARARQDNENISPAPNKNMETEQRPLRLEPTEETTTHVAEGRPEPGANVSVNASEIPAADTTGTTAAPK